MKLGKTIQRRSKSALITEGQISNRVDKSPLFLLMFFLAQGTLMNHWPPSSLLWEEVRVTGRWFKGAVSSTAPRLLNFIEKPNTSSHCQICPVEIHTSWSLVLSRVKDNSKSFSAKTMKHQEFAESRVRSVFPFLLHSHQEQVPSFQPLWQVQCLCQMLSWERETLQIHLPPKHEQVMATTWEKITKSSILPALSAGPGLVLGAVSMGEEAWYGCRISLTSLRWVLHNHAAHHLFKRVAVLHTER